MDEDDTLLGYEGEATSNHMMLGDENGFAARGQDGGTFVMGAQPSADLVVWGTNINIVKIQEDFSDFFSSYCEMGESEPLYLGLLRRVVDTQVGYINIDCEHLHSHSPDLYDNLVNYPTEVVPLFDSVVQELVNEELARRGDMQEGTVLQVQVRTFNLMDLKSMRDLNPTDLDKLIAVKGMITRTGAVLPDLKEGFFRCGACAAEMRVQIDRGRIAEPAICENCNTRGAMELIHNRCWFADKQVNKLQETPESIPDGETPATVSIYAYDTLVDVAKPGDRVVVTGIYRASPVRPNSFQRTTHAIYRTYVDVLHYKKEETNTLGVGDEEAMGEVDSGITSDSQSASQQPGWSEPSQPSLSQSTASAPVVEEGTTVAAHLEEKKRKIEELATRPDIYELLARSVAPGIWGLDDIKKGMLLQLFGGTGKRFKGGGAPRCRGEINILLCGDPGTSKSQLLSSVHRLAPRGIYTSGKGSSAVGLTAYITRDPDTRQTVLESGALVLSDRGLCCIDEFDKMSDHTRSILHEAMEQQTVSVAKAGIICTLNARTSILASANPRDSRYNPRLSVVDNIQLPPTLLSRFDLIFLVLDRADQERDRRLAQHIVSLYTDHASRSRPVQDILDTQAVKDYIAYARAHVHPVISDEAATLLAEEYVAMRRLGRGHGKTITATTRQLESLIRLSEAHARMRLSQVVDLDAVKEAARLVRVALHQAATDPRTGTIDMDLLTTGRSATARERTSDLANAIQQLLLSHTGGVKVAQIVDALRRQSSVEVSVGDVKDALQQLCSQGTVQGTGEAGNPHYALV